MNRMSSFRSCVATTESGFTRRQSRKLRRVQAAAHKCDMIQVYKSRLTADLALNKGGRQAACQAQRCAHIHLHNIPCQLETSSWPFCDAHFVPLLTA